MLFAPTINGLLNVSPHACRLYGVDVVLVVVEGNMRHDMVMIPTTAFAHFTCSEVFNIARLRSWRFGEKSKRDCSSVMSQRVLCRHHTSGTN